MAARNEAGSVLTWEGGARRRRADVAVLVLALAGAALAADPASGADPDEGRAARFWVDPVVPAGVAGDAGAHARAGAEVAPYPLEQTFALHSLPGSKRTLMLDFDGADVRGTLANDRGLPDGPVEGWSLDGDPATFDDDERAFIQSVWQRVAEDYAPFDVDVTTQEPGFDAISRTDEADQVYGTRALLTDSAAAVEAVCGACAGAASGDVFDTVEPNHSYSQPAWVFPALSGGIPKYVADTVSHEVGHNFGLGHSDTVDGTYEGHQMWMPIMGYGYSFAVSQWTDGEYAGATNLTDEVARIAENGAPLRADDVPDGAPAAWSSSRGGVIGARTDRDSWLVGYCSGPGAWTASPAPVGPNLDLAMTVEVDGTVVELVDPPATTTADFDVAAGLAAPSATAQREGRVVLTVDGVGVGDPATTGYSDYGSLGRYTISGTPCRPTEPTALSGAATGAHTATVGWTAPLADGDRPVTGYSVTVNGGAPVDVGLATARTVTGLVAGQPNTVTVAARNAVGTGPAASVVVRTPPAAGTAPGATPKPKARSGRPGGRSTAKLRWQPPTSTGGVPLTGYRLLVYKLNTKGKPSRTTTVDVGPTALRHTFRLKRGSYRFAVQALNGLGQGPVGPVSASVRSR